MITRKMFDSEFAHQNRNQNEWGATSERDESSYDEIKTKPTHEFVHKWHIVGHAMTLRHFHTHIISSYNKNRMRFSI